MQLQVVCKSCGEPWDFSEVSEEDFLDFFSEEDWVYLFPLQKNRQSWMLASLDFLVASLIDSGRGCFSCGFDPLYQKSWGGDLRKGDEVVNHGTVVSISGEYPDPSVGIFSGWVEVTFRHSDLEDLVPLSNEATFEWDEGVLIKRRKR